MSEEKQATRPRWDVAVVMVASIVCVAGLVGWIAWLFLGAGGAP